MTRDVSGSGLVLKDVGNVLLLPGLRSQMWNVRLRLQFQIEVVVGPFQNFRFHHRLPTLTPTSCHNVNKIWLSTILQQLAINGNVVHSTNYLFQ